MTLEASLYPHRRRNQNYLDILRLLSLGDRQLSAFDISLRFTHLFWFGDLNYRLDMDIQVQMGPMVTDREAGLGASWAPTSVSGSKGSFQSLCPHHRRS